MGPLITSDCRFNRICDVSHLDESVDLIYLDPPFNSQATYRLCRWVACGSPHQ
jgi:16S rRNA G966 N2-methylase RsmD